MAVVDLMALEKTTISRDLRDKYILIYSLPKVGKTTFASQVPDNIILCFEKGVNFLSDIYAVDIPKWSDFKVLFRQLRREDVRAKYKTVTIDTVSIAWSLCEQYICEKHDVEAIGDIPYGKGYQFLTNEFANALREISMLGYGIILIAHANERLEKISEDKTVLSVSPKIPDRAQDIINALVDIIGYIHLEFNEDGSSKRTLITKRTPYIVAGTRLRYLEEKIPFGYQELIEAMFTAIEKQQKIDGDTVTAEHKLQRVIKQRDFSETQAEAKEFWINYVGEDLDKAEEVMNSVEKVFGKRMKLSDIPESQQDLFELLLEELKSL